MAGGFALAGVLVQQAISARNDAVRRRADRVDRSHHEQHLAVIDVVKSGRRVQRALVQCSEAGGSSSTVALLQSEVDQLAEAVAVVRLLVRDEAVIEAARALETKAKKLLKDQVWDSTRLQISPFIREVQRLEDSFG